MSREFNNESETGTANGDNSEANQSLREAFLTGKTITIIRSDGSEDCGWTVHNFNKMGSMTVIKEGVGRKDIGPEHFVRMDEEKQTETLSVGSTVVIQRSSGGWEKDWIITEFIRNKNNTGMDVIVASPDGMHEKTIPYNILLKWNNRV